MRFMGTYEKIKQKIVSYKNDKKSEHFMHFFKTGKGEYGEGDEFLGLSVPMQREIAKEFWNEVSIEDLQKLLDDKYHEIRLTALLMMVMIYEKQPEMSKQIVDLYLKNTKNINNWDLVDLSCSKILGAYCYKNNKSAILKKLSSKSQMWPRRIAIVSTYYYIKREKYDLTIEFAKKYLGEREDLMHKATGWMLREVGKSNIGVLYSFLDKYCLQLPRTALRYSIERLPEDKRLYYLHKKS